MALTNPFCDETLQMNLEKRIYFDIKTHTYLHILGVKKPFAILVVNNFLKPLRMATKLW